MLSLHREITMSHVNEEQHQRFTEEVCFINFISDISNFLNNSEKKKYLNE
jgi:hypothetical protein